MRIAVVHSFYTAALPSGENRVVEDQVSALRRAGHDVELISRHTDDLSSEFGYVINSAMRVATGRGHSPLKELVRFQPDVVHVHNLFPNFGTSWLGKWPGPIVMSLHNYRFACANGQLFREGSPCFECPEHGPWRAVQHGCYRDSRLATVPLAIGLRERGYKALASVDFVISTSSGSDQIIRALSGMDNIRLIPNFGASNGQEPLPGNRRAGWVAVGRLTSEKGIGAMAQEWPGPDVLTVIGDGPEAAAIRDLGDGGRVRWLPSMPINELREALPLFKGIVFPSVWPDVAPQVVVEAMSVGLPVVARSSNVVASLVEKSSAGLAYSDQQSLTDAVRAVEASLDHYSYNSKKLFEAEWTEDAWLHRIIALYLDACTLRRN